MFQMCVPLLTSRELQQRPWGMWLDPGLLFVLALPCDLSFVCISLL